MPDHLFAGGGCRLDSARRHTGFAGSVFHYHLSLNQNLIHQGDCLNVVGTVELNGYSFRGQFTDPSTGNVVGLVGQQLSQRRPRHPRAILRPLRHGHRHGLRLRQRPRPRPTLPHRIPRAVLSQAVLPASSCLHCRLRIDIKQKNREFPMVQGVHTMFYSSKPEELRCFLATSSASHSPMSAKVG